MRNKRISKKARSIVIGLLLGITLLGTITFGFSYQHKKINELEKQIYIEQNTTDERLNYSETELDTSSIEEELNELNTYTVLSNKVKIKHTYNYSREKLLGMRGNATLVGEQEFYYEYCVDLANAEILSYTKEGIKIAIDKPRLNEDTCHGIKNTFVKLEDDSNSSLLINKDDTERLMTQWQDTYERDSKEKVKDLDNQDKLNSIAKSQVRNLMKSLGVTGKINIIIK